MILYIHTYIQYTYTHTWEKYCEDFFWGFKSNIFFCIKYFKLRFTRPIKNLQIRQLNYAFKIFSSPLSVRVHFLLFRQKRDQMNWFSHTQIIIDFFNWNLFTSARAQVELLSIYSACW